MIRCFVSHSPSIRGTPEAGMLLSCSMGSSVFMRRVVVCLRVSDANVRVKKEKGR